MNQTHDKISRHTLLWLLACNVAVLLPLIDKASLATLGICGICFVWRIGIYFGRVAKPPRWLVTALAISAASTLLLVSREIGMLNALINLLILGYALKYIEMREQRDILAIILAGYFLIALAFIDKQAISDAAVSLLVCAINTATLLSVYRGQQPLLLQARQAAILMLQSVPLAIALFIILPRLAPLWLVPQSKSATTGLSDQISIGDITQLTRSQALAFRVTFESTPPPANQLYWRAMVLSDYDGSTWQQSAAVRDINWFRPFNIDEAAKPQTNSAPLNYSVIAERSGQRWLFALDRASSRTRAVKILPDYRLVSLKPIEQQFQYQVSSYLAAPLNDRISARERRADLAFNRDRNPQTQALAQQLSSQFPAPRQRLNAIMQLFNQQPFYYTLSPKPLGRDQLDEFLFDTRQGFCVHYASAFTMLARASGLPARMVAGYQGGIYNREAGYMSVYQYMAHAWSEVWLDGQWVRFDPTAMIAPERIEQGFDSLFSPEESYLADTRFRAIRNSSWFNSLRQQFANLDYYWTVWVLGFDEQRQQQLLAQLLGKVTPLRIALFLASVIAIVLLFIAWQTGLLRLPERRSAVDRAFDRVVSAAAKAGLARPVSMGPSDFSQQLINRWPQHQPAITAWCQHYLAIKYQSLTANELIAIKSKFIQLSKQVSEKLSKQ